MIRAYRDTLVEIAQNDGRELAVSVRVARTRGVVVCLNYRKPTHYGPFYRVEAHRDEGAGLTLSFEEARLGG